MKVKYRLPLLIVLIAVLPIIILTTVGFQLIKNMSEEYYRNLIYNQSAASAKHVDDFYTEQSDAISYSSNIDTYKSYLLAAESKQIPPELKKQAAKLLYLAQQVNPDVSKTYIADKYGNVSLSSNEQDTEKNIADDTAFRSAIEKNQISYRVNKTGNGILLACPITDTAGNALGVLMREINMDYLNRYVKDLKIGDSGYLYILDREGCTLSHYYKNRVDMFENSWDPGASNLLALSQSMKDDTITQKNGFFEYSLNGKELLASYTIVPSTDWAVVAVVPLDEITASARNFNASMLKTGIAVVLGAILIGLISAGRIVKPLEKIRDTVSNIADGKLNTPIHYSGRDEFAELFADVKIMAHKLNTSYQELTNSARTDVLTGLSNRLAIYEVMDDLFDNSQKQAAIMLDLDGFKQVNDTLGHDFGDCLLMMVGKIIQDISTPNIIGARLGGDEFFVFISEYKHKKDIIALGEKLLHEICSIKEVNGKAVMISASVGISYVNKNDMDKSYLMKKADIAMYTAKKSGKSSCIIYDNTIAIDQDFDRR